MIRRVSGIAEPGILEFACGVALLQRAVGIEEGGPSACIDCLDRPSTVVQRYAFSLSSGSAVHLGEAGTPWQTGCAHSEISERRQSTRVDDPQVLAALLAVAEAKGVLPLSFGTILISLAPSRGVCLA